jgi:hypothetical protein
MSGLCIGRLRDSIDFDASHQLGQAGLGPVDPAAACRSCTASLSS